MLTFYNVARMSLAVKAWRARIAAEGLISEREAARMTAPLLVFIDDGTARLNLPKTDAGIRMANLFKEVANNTYKKYGLSLAS